MGQGSGALVGEEDVPFGEEHSVFFVFAVIIVAIFIGGAVREATALLEESLG